MPIHNISEIIEDIRQGKMIIMLDDEDRENEGDIIMAAEKVTPWHINFMARFACGLICLPLPKDWCERLNLPLMVKTQERSKTNFNPAFTVSIEAARGVETGISAADRARTILTVVKDDTGPGDLVRPGHVFPIMACLEGVLVRPGHTEASVDLAKLAGLKPVAILCEILNEDGTMARRADLELFSKKHHLKLGTIADLVAFRRAKLKELTNELA